MLITTILYLFY